MIFLRKNDIWRAQFANFGACGAPNWHSHTKHHCSKCRLPGEMFGRNFRRNFKNRINLQKCLRHKTLKIYRMDNDFPLRYRKDSRDTERGEPDGYPGDPRVGEPSWGSADLRMEVFSYKASARRRRAKKKRYFEVKIHLF